MQWLRKFGVGVLGGAVGAALLILVLVVVFDFGDSEQAGNPSPVRTPVVVGGGGDTSGYSPAQIYDRVSGGVVMVRATFAVDESWNPWGGSQNAQSLGTGFVASDEGDIITNAHVVLNEQGQAADKVTVVFNRGGGEGEEFDARLVGVEADSDVAILRVDPDEAPVEPLTLGDSSKVVVGEPVVAIGNPLGYDFSITSGIVSAVGRSIQAPTGAVIPNAIQTDAAINPGNSGGPLINARGEVIGVNEQIATQSGGNEGLGFAVPINTAVRVMEQLTESGEVAPAWLGIAGRTLTPDLAQTFELTVDRGVLVESVVEDGPADKAGIRGGDDTVTLQGQPYTVGGDVIVRIDDTQVESFEDLTGYLAGKKPGDRVEVEVVRDGTSRTIAVTLGERPANM
jgi:S1-C subfamily serine protease